jgi:RND superfamily putative drug exporter
MDYEVFLLSRVREEYVRTGDPVESVADGLASTARVITAAAAIMIVVFGSFALEDDRLIKMLGTGLAVAVLLDVTLVRMVLVPATMELLGEKNWWMPAWLDRILPRLSVERPARDPDATAPAEATQPSGPTVSAGKDPAEPGIRAEQAGERQPVEV